MTAPTRTLYDVQTDLDLDAMLEAAVPPPACEFRMREGDEPCGELATWILSISCGHSYYYDDGHHDLVSSGLDAPDVGAEYCAEDTRSPRHAVPIRVTHIWSRIA